MPNERLVYTELFEMPGISEDDATVNTVTLEESDGPHDDDVRHRMPRRGGPRA